MAVQRKSPFAMTTGAASIAIYRLVKLSGATVIHNTVTSTDEPIGVTQAAQATSGSEVSVADIKDGGTKKLTFATACDAGADIYAAADGKVSALSAVAGTYLKVGKNLAIAASGDGAIQEVWLDPTRETSTVSS
ncbi:MAG TPA: hypothetical protein VMW48_03205 [Vicinamibacterales bacterium]|nr:hypothetical protein [Vicinamibacterales bacterium]HUW33346.1 hypothetical protein [Planctomycetota bacterium]